jgi:hypothetical protein
MSKPLARNSDPQSAKAGAKRASLVMGWHKCIVLGVLYVHRNSQPMPARAIAEFALNEGWCTLPQVDTIRRRVIDVHQDGWTTGHPHASMPTTYRLKDDRVDIVRRLMENGWRG